MRDCLTSVILIRMTQTSATYTDAGHITVTDIETGTSDYVGTYDADGGTWQDEVRDILRQYGYESVGDWKTDPETSNSTIEVRVDAARIVG